MSKYTDRDLNFYNSLVLPHVKFITDRLNLDYVPYNTQFKFIAMSHDEIMSFDTWDLLFGLDQNGIVDKMTTLLKKKNFKRPCFTLYMSGNPAKYHIVIGEYAPAGEEVDIDKFTATSYP